MHMSMGMDSTKFVRDAYSATLRALAFSSSVAGLMPRIFFWFCQIGPQTLISMIVPSHAPMPIVTRLRSPVALFESPNVNAGTNFGPRSHAPAIQVMTRGPAEPEEGARGDIFRDARAARPALVGRGLARAPAPARR